jgi:MFS family permease
VQSPGTENRYPNGAPANGARSLAMPGDGPLRAEPSDAALTTFGRIFRALRHRNYRLFFGGQSVSLIGTWMQRIAMGWIAYRLTNSAWLLGVVGFAGQIPTFVLSPFTGVLADRWNRRPILVVTQTLSMVQAAILAVLILTGHIQVWHLIVLACALGTVNALDIPVRQAFVVQMVERRDLGNAIALNSSMVNAARLLGPSIAGILIAAFGEGICFLLNAISYAGVIIALIAMKLPAFERPRRTGHAFDGLHEGFTYAWRSKPIKYIVLLLALVSLMGMPYQLLMPVFARDILHGGAHTLGFLMGATGLGALVGTLYLASRRSVHGLGRTIPLAATVFGAGLITFAFSRMIWLSLVFVLVAGFGMVVQMASSNTVLQTIVDDDKRGRVMSFYTMAFMGMAPFGSLLAGGLASAIGAPGTLMIGGAACVMGALLFRRELPEIEGIIHPIYRRMGIMPEMNP